MRIKPLSEEASQQAQSGKSKVLAVIAPIAWPFLQWDCEPSHGTLEQTKVENENVSPHSHIKPPMCQ